MRLIIIVCNESPIMYSEKARSTHHHFIGIPALCGKLKFITGLCISMINVSYKNQHILSIFF